MRTRIIILIVALVLGGIAAFMAAQYLGDARTKIAKESEPIEVLVAQEDIPRGVTSEDLVRAGSVKLEQVPKRFVAADSVSSPRAIEGQVLATPLSKGQQVTSSSFQVPSTAGLAFSIPKDQQAVAIPVSEVTGVSGLVKPGDLVAVYVTFSPGPAGEADFTKQLLTDVKVLSVGAAMQGDVEAQEQESGGGISSNRSSNTSKNTARTLTLALSAADTEKLIFAQQTGDLWCALLPANAADVPATSGQTLETVMR